MKKLIFILLAVVAISLTSCQKETSCQVINKTGSDLTEVTIWEFDNNGVLIEAGNVGDLADGAKTKIFPMLSTATSVKVSFKNGAEMRYTNYNALANGETTVIEIYATTPTTDNLYD